MDISLYKLSCEDEGLIKKYKLPRKVVVHVRKIKDNFLLALFPNLPGAHSQVEGWEKLDKNVNGVLLSYFDVPEQYSGKIFYQKEKEVKK